MVKYWYAFWIWLAYALRLRKPWNNINRWLWDRKTPEAEPPSFSTPQEMVDYAQVRFNWRKDATRIGGWLMPLDWVTKPSKFQYKLENGYSEDGDCDDYHTWIYDRLVDMGYKPMMCSVGYPGGGHAVTVFRDEYGWWLVNYRLQKIADPMEVPQIIAEWGTDAPEEPKVHWYIFDTYPDFKKLAQGPNGKV